MYTSEQTMKYEACTLCGNPVDTVSSIAVRTGGNLKEGWAHEVCQLRHVASVRLNIIEGLRNQVQQLEDELNGHYERRHWPRGLVGRAWHWLLWEC